MENGRPMKTEGGSEFPEATSGDSTSWQRSESTEGGALGNSPTLTTATTPKGSKKTWKNAELEALQSKAGLVAGALADFQSAKGIVVTQETTYTAPSGRRRKAVKLFLIVEDVDLVAEKTADGLDFKVVAAAAE